MLHQVADSFRNVIARLGGHHDKGAQGYYAFEPTSALELSAAYRTSALARRVVDLPAEDATREWRAWQAEADQISAIEAEERRLGVQRKVLEAQTRARLYGGAAIYIGTGDVDPAEPLDPARIGREGIRHLTVLPRADLAAEEIETDARLEGYGKPRFWRIRGETLVHPSRLAIFHGAQTLEDWPTDGWADSVLQSMLEQVKRVDTGAAAIVSLIIEAKIDVFGIPNFASGLAAGGKEYEDQVVRRLGLMNLAKGINSAIVMDAEETYEQKHASFGGLPEIMDRLMMLCSGASGIPQTLLFGRSPSGLNSTGESDIRGYYDRVKVHQEMSMTPALAVLDECLIHSALGSRPDDVHYNWRPLWQPDASERAEIGAKIADTFDKVHRMGVIAPEAVASAVVNALTEAGAAPGLESAVDEFPYEEPDPVEMGVMPPLPSQQESEE